MLNSILGMSHRSRPYDMLNPEDLIEMTEQITAEYIDMRYYWSTISTVNSDFDETIETFYPAKWMSISLEGSTGDNDMDRTIYALNSAEDYMGRLMFRAEKRCTELWKMILHSDFKEVKEYFLGKNFELDEAKLEYVFGEGLDHLFKDFDYTGNVEQSTKEFVKLLLKHVE